MSRNNQDEYKDGRLINGFNYQLQVWVRHGRYVRCGHPEAMNCSCYGRLHAGQETTKSLRGLEVETCAR